MATGVDVRVDGKVVKTIESYTVEEESTPIDVSDSTGATGRFTVPFFSNSLVAVKRMRRKIVRLEDKGQGSTQGIARVPSGSSSSITVAVDSRLSLLSVERTAQPFDGTLGDYFIYLLGLVGITTDYFVEPALADKSAVFPGWQGDVWFYMKKMLSAKGAEVSLVSNMVIMRAPRGRITVDKRDLDSSWAVNDENLALSVEGYYYNNVYRLKSLAYPVGGWNEDVQVFQVDSEETVEFDIPISSSLLSVEQPVSMNFVGKDEISDSVYSVTSNDGFPYSAAQWDAEGGKVSVTINKDTRSITIKIVGPSNTRYAPFRIAASSGPSDSYSSLRLVGRGVFFDKKLVSMNTAVSPDLASQEIGFTVDNEFISTLEELYDALIWPLARFGGSRQTIDIRTTGINRSGESGTYAYPKISEFNSEAALLGWADIAAFNSYYTGNTIQEFNDLWAARTADSFVNQAFGNVAGARTKRDFAWWRIRRATIEPSSISYTAEADTTLGDFSAEWSPGGVPKLVSDFNTQWTGRTIDDFNVAPLEGIS